VKLPRTLRGAPAAGEQPRRRRGRVRDDAPRTIVPAVDDLATPSWLHADVAPVAAPRPPLAADLDAARARLRREIPPVADDE
jgi:hypothetical protein